MNKSLFSADWYRVSALVVKLKAHTKLARHIYRDQVWYVLRDRLTGEHHRFNENAYKLIGMLDGQRNMQQVWQAAIASLGEQAPTQSDVIQLLSELYNADVLQTSNPIDAGELFDKAGEKERKKWLAKMASPLAVKIPLIDPDRFLTRFQARFRWVFSRLGLVLWLCILAYAVMLANMHWSDLTSNIRDTVLTPYNLLLLTLLFPILKALHELGHAFAVKVWGGEVHEIGVMFLVFIPVPYVDASAASLFPERHKRLVVGAAGMMVEVCVACLALVAWVWAEQGTFKTLAYNIVLIAGVSTLFFNANPLLRFDGYFILSDILQIPNLYQRSYRFIEYLAKTRLMGEQQKESPVNAPGEPFWFLAYAIASWLYRIGIVLVIAQFVAQKFFFIGVLLACWSIYMMFLKPILGMARYLFRYNQNVNRTRSNTIIVISFSLIVAALSWPLPHWTSAEGIIWVPEDNYIKAGANCFVRSIAIQQGSLVEEGQVILSCDDPLLDKEIAVKRANLKETEVRYLNALKSNRLELALVEEQVESDQAELERLLETKRELTIRANQPAQVYLPNFNSLSGKYIAKGDVLGYMVEPDFLIRVVVRQKDASYVRTNTNKVEFRRVSRVEEKYAADLKRQIPGGSNSLPSKILGTLGGGAFPVKPNDPDGIKTFDWQFQFDVHPRELLDSANFNERIFVRFYHDKKPLALRLFRAIELFIMEEINV